MDAVGNNDKLSAYIPSSFMKLAVRNADRRFFSTLMPSDRAADDGHTGNGANCASSDERNATSTSGYVQRFFDSLGNCLIETLICSIDSSPLPSPAIN